MRLPILFLLLATGLATRVGALDVVEIRGRSDAPNKADREGFSLNLIDTHTPDFCVGVFASVPDSFGEIQGAGLTVRDETGSTITSVAVAEGVSFEKGKKSFDFSLKRELLKNSVFSVTHRTETEVYVASFLLGTFAVTEHDLTKKNPSLDKVRVALAEFGVFKGIFDIEFTQTDKIPWEEGLQYGFRVYLRGDGRSVPMRVELQMPSPPKTWGETSPEFPITVSPDGRTGVRSTMHPTGKLIEVSWQVADGDPEGEHQVRVFVRDQLIKTFTFTVRRER